ncbi:UNVERIFIED_CONTAM: hypothetical protein RMT77_015803 [Armadillidium vulgare]
MMLHLRNLYFKIVFAYYLIFRTLHASVELPGSQNWKSITVNETQLGNEITVTTEVSLASLLICVMFANHKGTNSFCYQDGLCRLFYMQPCLLPDNDLVNKNSMECYSTTSLLALKSRIPKKATFNKYAGCVWGTDVELETFWEAKDKCNENGGQLITFEHFPTEKEFTDFTSILEHNDSAYVGLMRNGTTSDFVWVTGTVLSRDSFLWKSGEPNSSSSDMVCGNMDTGKLDDDICVRVKPANCQIYFPL